MTILPVTPRKLEALENDRAALAAVLGGPVPEGWPMFPEAVTFTRRHLQQHPEQAGWWMHFFLHPGTRVLIGSGGCAGPPREGTVEIGYEIAPAFRGRHLGTAAGAALVEHARACAEVETVIAHTMAEHNASTHVLVTLGFSRAEEVSDPDAGTLWRWRLHLR
ncbi:GNAT family N-acetyltransferase [Kineococcus esterisolvens]|uniref:GNAT family N-acetyltransferase n=1 Tax=unclassified Kineococcus TaxID=2621656 RepID=UPI003D7E1430